ncbi:MAG TPA: hypothetical protein PLV10_06260, partial [Candidatus Latescibacteria bacterium]|nr:hypothetical protein [Candidatus Latescibacterota bacterium]
MQHLFGPLDRNRKELEEEFHVSLVSRQGQLLVRGTEAEVAAAVKELDQRLRGDLPVLGLGTASSATSSKKRSGEGHPPTGSPAGP